MPVKKEYFPRYLPYFILATSAFLTDYFGTQRAEGD